MSLPSWKSYDSIILSPYWNISCNDRIQWKSCSGYMFSKLIRPWNTFLFYWCVVYFNVTLVSCVEQSDSDMLLLLSCSVVSDSLRYHRFSHICTYISILLSIFHYGLLWDVEYSSLWYTVRPCCLPLLCIVLCVC